MINAVTEANEKKKKNTPIRSNLPSSASIHDSTFIEMVVATAGLRHRSSILQSAYTFGTSGRELSARRGNSVQSAEARSPAGPYISSGSLGFSPLGVRSRRWQTLFRASYLQFLLRTTVEVQIYRVMNHKCTRV